MRIIRFLDNDGVVHFGHDYDPETGMAAVLESGLFGGVVETDRRIDVRKRLAPLEPRSVLCIGLNYREHAEESDIPVPDQPVLFMKNPSAVQNPGDPIHLPGISDRPEVDYEAELAVVIGKTARNVSRERAMEYVQGFTAANDVSARHWQKHLSGGQWGRGKSFDTFCPLGPALVTPDELPDPQNLRIRAILNGEVMQDASTSDMIFPISELIANLSRDMTLVSGTVLLTGTPAGVGAARDPQVFLSDGDEITIEVEGIGELTNPVQA